MVDIKLLCRGHGCGCGRTGHSGRIPRNGTQMTLSINHYIFNLQHIPGIQNQLDRLHARALHDNDVLGFKDELGQVNRSLFADHGPLL